MKIVYVLLVVSLLAATSVIPGCTITTFGPPPKR